MAEHTFPVPFRQSGPRQNAGVDPARLCSGLHDELGHVGEEKAAVAGNFDLAEVGNVQIDLAAAFVAKFALTPEIGDEDAPGRFVEIGV